MLKNLVQVKAEKHTLLSSANTSAFTASCIVALSRNRTCAYIKYRDFLSDAQYSDCNLIRGFHHPFLKEFCKSNTQSLVLAA